MSILILTSAGFRTKKLQEELLKILTKRPSALRLIYITTAAKVKDSRDFVEKDRKVLTGLGFKITEYDIEGKTADALRRDFMGADIIYVQGGSAFYLLKQIRLSGFDAVISDLIEKGVIYIGSSAGSYLACPSIERALWGAGDRERYGLRDMTALNFVPFLLSVHYNREKYREGLPEGIARAKYPVKILTDAQALLVQDGVVRLIGTGKEVRL